MAISCCEEHHGDPSGLPRQQSGMGSQREQPRRWRWRHKSGGFVVATALDTLHVCCMRKYMHVHANVYTLHVHTA